MPPKPKLECDQLTQQLKLIDCWSQLTDTSQYIPESVMEFNLHISASCRTSTLWNAACLLSAASNACNFTVDVDEQWTSEKVPHGMLY